VWTILDDERNGGSIAFVDRGTSKDRGYRGESSSTSETVGNRGRFGDGRGEQSEIIIASEKTESAETIFATAIVAEKVQSSTANANATAAIDVSSSAQVQPATTTIVSAVSSVSAKSAAAAVQSKSKSTISTVVEKV